MNHEIMDTRLQAKLRNLIDVLPSFQQIQLKNLRYCGSRVIQSPGGHSPGVFLLKSDDNAKFWGTTSCKSSWACPVCTAKKMSQYAGDIACAIEAIRKFHGQVAIMVTLNIIHYKSLSCLELTEILYNSWKKFTIQGNKQHAGLKRKNWKASVWSQFCEYFNCTHRVRVTEYTYNNEHGWNPHFHCLFWVDKDKLHEVGAWEEKLKEFWIHHVKNEWAKYRSAHDSDETHDYKYYYDHIEWTYNYGKIKNKISQPLYISKDKNGKVREQLSSDYISGWGADKELTGNSHKRATCEDSRTPFQLLEDFANNNDETAGKLFIEYALATKFNRHARVNFSAHSGIKKIIVQWKKTNEYITNMKKKFTRVWKTLIWFPSEQWNKICEADSDFNVKENLLYLAAVFDPDEAWQKIYEYMLLFDIDISENQYNFWADFYDNSKYCA